MDKSSRQELYSIIDHLHDEDLDEARKMLKEFVESRDLGGQERRMTPKEQLAWMNSLPYDDDLVLTPEELAHIEESKKAYQEGKFQTWDEVARELEI